MTSPVSSGHCTVAAPLLATAGTGEAVAPGGGGAGTVLLLLPHLAWCVLMTHPVSFLCLLSGELPKSSVIPTVLGQ